MYYRFFLVTKLGQLITCHGLTIVSSSLFDSSVGFLPLGQ